MSSVTHTLMARRNTRDKTADWKKNILIEWYRSPGFPFRDSDREYTEDNYENFHACFIDTHAIVYTSAKTPKVYTADLVADLKKDAYLVPLKAWLDAGNASKMTVIPPKKIPVRVVPVPPPPPRVAPVPPPPPRVAPVPPPARAALPVGYGPAVGYGDFVPRAQFEHTRHQLSQLFAEKEKRDAELQTAQEEIQDIKRAMRDAADKEVRRRVVDNEAQRKAAEQAQMATERAEILADKAALQKKVEVYNAKTNTPTADPKKRAREPDTDTLPTPKIAKSEHDPATIMGAFGVTFGAVAMGVAISPMIPVGLTSAALAWLVKAQLDAAKKK